VKAKRVKAQRMRAWAEVLEARARLKKSDPLKNYAGTVTVRLTRIAPRMLDAHDNLCSSLKAIVDGIADAWGVKDNSGLVGWEYSQEKSKARHYAVRIEISEYVPPWEREEAMYKSSYRTSAKTIIRQRNVNQTGDEEPDADTT